jgi:hypothetical protein
VNQERFQNEYDMKFYAAPGPADYLGAMGQKSAPKIKPKHVQATTKHSYNSIFNSKVPKMTISNHTTKDYSFNNKSELE